MSASETREGGPDLRRRIRNGALGLAVVAAGFYLGIIFLLVHRSHH